MSDSASSAPDGATETRTQPGPQAAPTERSSAERLPVALLDAVDAATAAGAIIEQITALIRSAGYACSGSAAGRRAKDLSALIRQEREARRANRAWAEEVGARSDDRAGLIAIESLLTLAISALAEVAQREGPVPVDELNRLALALSRIESIDRLRQARERDQARAVPGAGQAPPDFDG